MLRGHQALFVTFLSVPMRMTHLPSADGYVLRLWPGDKEGDSTERGRLKRILCVWIFLLHCLERHFLPCTDHWSPTWWWISTAELLPPKLCCKSIGWEQNGGRLIKGIWMVSLSAGNYCLQSSVATCHSFGKVSCEEIDFINYIVVKCNIKIPAVCISDLRSTENVSLDSLLIFRFFKEKDKEESISNGIN